jgi:hypothetical protein
MQEQRNIIECYNKTAENFTDKFLNELDRKSIYLDEKKLPLIVFARKGAERQL